MSISRILELAGLSRIDENVKTEISESTGNFGFLRSLNEMKTKKKKLKKDLSEASDDWTKEASKLENELNGLKRKKVKTEADKARMARIEKLITGLEKKIRDKNDLKENWDVHAADAGWTDSCIRIARLFNTTPQIVWEVKNHMHNYDIGGQHGHIPHGVIGKAIAEYIDQNKDTLYPDDEPGEDDVYDGSVNQWRDAPPEKDLGFY